MSKRLSDPMKVGGYLGQVVVFTVLAGLALACQAPGLAELAASMRAVAGPGSLLFQDDFSDPTSGWDRVRDREGITDYQDGVYRVVVEKPHWYFWSTPGLRFKDVRIEVDVARLAGAEVIEMGLICRYVDEGNFYLFSITSDGFFGVVRFQDGQEDLLDMAELKPSPAIQQGTAINHLRADCIGSTLRFYANGDMLAEVQANEFISGDVGLLVGTFEEPGADVAFDHFVALAP